MGQIRYHILALAPSLLQNGRHQLEWGLLRVAQLSVLMRISHELSECHQILNIPSQMIAVQLSVVFNISDWWKTSLQLQMEEKLRKQGMTDVKLSWKVQPNGEFFRKKEGGVKKEKKKTEL